MVSYQHYVFLRKKEFADIFMLRALESNPYLVVTLLFISQLHHWGIGNLYANHSLEG